MIETKNIDTIINLLKKDDKLTKSGEYWVAPLKPKKFNPYKKLKISKELRGYIR
ncbi:hypothetical protein JW865_04650 [Candidatus Bathyarchaeota archaeon]|nr:hypothetical protein [Candidatus Bathyarchaeota archaeon]